MRKVFSGNLILLLLLLVAVGSAVYFYRQASVLKDNPQAVARQEARELVDEISKLIVLPEGEDPTVATIADAEKLKAQPFFANAKNGNKVLIYTKAKKAILYDVDSHKIVEVAPLNIGDPEGKAAAAPAVTAPATTNP